MTHGDHREFSRAVVSRRQPTSPANGDAQAARAVLKDLIAMARAAWEWVMDGAGLQRNAPVMQTGPAFASERRWVRNVQVVIALAPALRYSQWTSSSTLGCSMRAWADHRGREMSTPLRSSRVPVAPSMSKIDSSRDGFMSEVYRDSLRESGEEQGWTGLAPVTWLRKSFSSAAVFSSVAHPRRCTPVTHDAW